MEIGGSSLATRFENMVDTLFLYKKSAIGGFVLAVGVVISFFCFRHYRFQVQVAAHQDFVKVLEVLKAPILTSASRTQERLVFSTERDKWNAVEEECARGYERNSSSGLAPMFQIMRSEALIHLEKREEALQVSQHAIDSLKSPELKAFYVLKHALMQLDSDQEKVRHDGIETLKKIAFDRHNLAHDQALYQLGLYHWIEKRFDEAKSYWQQFVVTYDQEQALAHQVEEVKEKLKLIAV